MNTSERRPSICINQFNAQLASAAATLTRKFNIIVVGPTNFSTLSDRKSNVFFFFASLGRLARLCPCVSVYVRVFPSLSARVCLYVLFRASLYVYTRVSLYTYAYARTRRLRVHVYTVYTQTDTCFVVLYVQIICIYVYRLIGYV